MSNFEAKQGNLRKLHRSGRVVGYTRLNSPLVMLKAGNLLVGGSIVALSSQIWFASGSWWRRGLSTFRQPANYGWLLHSAGMRQGLCCSDVSLIDNMQVCFPWYAHASLVPSAFSPQQCTNRYCVPQRLPLARLTCHF